MRVHERVHVVRIADRSNYHANLCHPRALIWSSEVDERRAHGEKVKERGEERGKEGGGGGRGGGVAAAGAGRRYKEHYVQRRKTKWERDAQRCPDEWGRWGWQGRPRRRGGTMDTRDGGKKDEDRKGERAVRGGGESRGAEKSATRSYEEGPTPPVDSREKWTLRGRRNCVPAPYNVQSSRAGFSGMRDAMRCPCYRERQGAVSIE